MCPENSRGYDLEAEQSAIRQGCEVMHMDESVDKRRNPRFEVEGVSGFLTFSLDVRILNMSLEGMAVETNRLLSVNSNYIVKIAHGDDRLELKGKVVWSTLDRTVKLPEGEVLPVYRAGIQFLDSLDQKTKYIIGFIQDNRIVTLEKRILGRFKINEKSALIHYPQDFVVRKMSLSGMLIETEMPLEPEYRAEMIVRVSDGKEVPFTGRVAHVIPPKEGESFYSIGIEFVSISKSSLKLIKDFLGSLDGI